MAEHWVDRVVGAVAPVWQYRRLKARHATQLLERRYRAAGDMLQRHYEAAADGRRTQHWHRRQSDANAAIGQGGAKLRDATRDLVRNNPYARSALATIVNGAVGWGIEPTVKDDRFEAWSTTTACDADGRNNLAGLSKLVTRTFAESGEILVRRRWRRPTDGLPLPFQLQLLEPDFLDSDKDVPLLPNGGRIVRGVEFDAIGHRVAYWLFSAHPGSSLRFGGSIFGGSHRVPADDIAHVYDQERPGQVRGVTRFASTLLRFYDLGDAEDANLLKQKIAACLAVIFSDAEGIPGPVGELVEGGAGAAGEAKGNAALDIDTLSPGMMMNAPAGRTVNVVEPPRVTEFAEYAKSVLRSNAAGLGVSYEDMTGDFQDLSFSSARMSFLRHRPVVEDIQWRILIPQFLDRVWGWAVEASMFAGRPMPARTQWTPPPAPMVDPEREGLAAIRNVRGGIQNPFEVIRERGHVPEVFLEEYKAALDKLDELGIVLDSDVRYVTQQGQAQSKTATPEGSAKIQAERAVEELLRALPADRVRALLRKFE